MKLQRKHLIALVLLGLLTGAVAIAMRPQSLDVETARVVRAPLEETIDAEGRTRVRERYVITAPVAGRLERISLLEGSGVRAGDVVARLAPLPIDQQTAAEARSRLDGATAQARESDAQVAAVRAVLVQRQRELERARRLVDAGGIAPRDLELAQLAVQQSEEELRAAVERTAAAEANVRQARTALMSLDPAQSVVVPVRSPASGHVLRVPERSARVVPAGTPLIELGDARSIEVVIDVLSTDGATISPGDLVRLDDWGEEPVLVGRVRFVEPAALTKVSALGVDEQRVNVVVDVRNAPPSLGDGFRVEARIVVWAAPNVLTVPTSALVRDGSSWGVYVVRGARCERRMVRIGHIGGSAAEVLSGVESGNEVVLFPSDQVVDGARVTARER